MFFFCFGSGLNEMSDGADELLLDAVLNVKCTTKRDYEINIFLSL